jgi:hypothetical protein
MLRNIDGGWDLLYSGVTTTKATVGFVAITYWYSMRRCPFIAGISPLRSNITPDCAAVTGWFEIQAGYGLGDLQSSIEQLSGL